MTAGRVRRARHSRNVSPDGMSDSKGMKPWLRTVSVVAVIRSSTRLDPPVREK